MDNLLTCTCCSVDSKKQWQKKKKTKIEKKSSKLFLFRNLLLCLLFRCDERNNGLMTLDFWSNLCCLWSPRNTSIPVFVYSAVERTPDQMSPSELSRSGRNKCFHGLLFLSSSYLSILTLGILFSGLRPLKLFLTCSTYFWNDIHILAPAPSSPTLNKTSWRNLLYHFLQGKEKTTCYPTNNCQWKALFTSFSSQPRKAFDLWSALSVLRKNLGLRLLPKPRGWNPLWGFLVEDTCCADASAWAIETHQFKKKDRKTFHLYV